MKGGPPFNLAPTSNAFSVPYDHEGGRTVEILLTIAVVVQS